MATKLDTSKILTGVGVVKPVFEVVSARIGPFTGKRMKHGSASAEAVAGFWERNKPKEKQQQLQTV